MSGDNVLITDGDLRITLAVLRSLAHKGLDTCVAEGHGTALSFFSRYCKRKLIYPDPRKHYHGFVKAIQRLVRRAKFKVLFPISDWSILPISKHRKRIDPYVKLPIPEHDVVETAFDKSLTLRAAAGEGIPVPETYMIESVRELEETAKKISYPAVIKPRCSWVWNDGLAHFGRPKYVNSAAELLSAYKAIHKEFPFPLIQEFIPGNNYSVAVLYNNSKIRAICGIKVYRTLPVEGGNSILRESVKVDPKMKEYTSRLLKALDWHGIAEVEFKLDSRDSKAKLMEVNGRFWGSLEVAIASGVDFPYLLYRLTIDGAVRPTANYKIGIKSRWLGGDLQHLLAILRRTSTGYGTRYPRKWRTLLDFLRIYEKHMIYDSLSMDDPLPFFSPIYTDLLSSIKEGVMGMCKDKLRDYIS